MKPKIVISVTFDIGMLAQLALDEAQKMKHFKGLNIKSEPVYFDHDETCFDGIKISSIPDTEKE